MNDKIILFKSLFYKYLESFVPYFNQAKGRVLENNNIIEYSSPKIETLFRSFPRKLPEYQNIIRVLTSIAEKSEFMEIISFLSQIMKDLIIQRTSQHLNPLNGISSMLEKHHPNQFAFTLSFSLIFVSDLIAYILTKVYHSGVTDELISIGYSIISFSFSYQVVEKMIINQWAVIFSIISETKVCDILSKFQNFSQLNQIPHTIALLKYLRFDRPGSVLDDTTQLFISDTYAEAENTAGYQACTHFFTELINILKQMHKKRLLTNEFLIDLSNLPISATEYEDFLQQLFDFGWSLRDIKQYQLGSLALIGKTLLRSKKLFSKVNQFYQTRVYPAISDPGKVEQSLILFHLLVIGINLDPRWLFWEWGPSTRLPEFCYVKWASNAEPASTFQNAFMEHFFEKADFTICPDLFMNIILHLASIDWDNFFSAMAPRFMALPHSDYRFITFLRLIPFFVNTEFHKDNLTAISVEALENFYKLMNTRFQSMVIQLPSNSYNLYVKIASLSQNHLKVSCNEDNIQLQNKKAEKIVEKRKILDFDFENENEIPKEKQQTKPYVTFCDSNYPIKTDSNQKIFQKLEEWSINKFNATKFIFNESKITDESSTFFILNALQVLMSYDKTPSIRFLKYLLDQVFSPCKSEAQLAMSLCLKFPPKVLMDELNMHMLDYTNNEMRFTYMYILYTIMKTFNEKLNQFYLSKMIQTQIENPFDSCFFLKENSKSNERTSNDYDNAESFLYRLEMISFIYLASVSPSVRSMSWNLLNVLGEIIKKLDNEKNEQFKSSGKINTGLYGYIFSCFSQIEFHVKRRILQDKHGNGEISFLSALESDYYDIWTIFLSEICNVIISTNYTPLLSILPDGVSSAIRSYPPSSPEHLALLIFNFTAHSDFSNSLSNYISYNVTVYQPPSETSSPNTPEKYRESKGKISKTVSSPKLQIISKTDNKEVIESPIHSRKLSDHSSTNKKDNKNENRHSHKKKIELHEKTGSGSFSQLIPKTPTKKLTPIKRTNYSPLRNSRSSIMKLLKSYLTSEDSWKNHLAILIIPHIHFCYYIPVLEILCDAKNSILPDCESAVVQMIQNPLLTPKARHLLLPFIISFLAMLQNKFVLLNLNGSRIIKWTNDQESNVVKMISLCINFCKLHELIFKNYSPSDSLWPLPTRTIVIQFLLNWAQTKSSALNELREASISAISALTKVGPLFTDSSFFTEDNLLLFAKIEQYGKPVLSSLLCNHADLLLEIYINAACSFSTQIGSSFFDAIFDAFNLEDTQFIYSLSGKLLFLGLLYQQIEHPRAQEFMKQFIELISTHRKIDPSEISCDIECFHYATEALLDSALSILKLPHLAIPLPDIIASIRPWVKSIRLLPKQTSLVPGTTGMFKKFTPYQFLRALMIITEDFSKSDFELDSLIEQNYNINLNDYENNSGSFVKLVLNNNLDQISMSADHLAFKDSYSKEQKNIAIQMHEKIQNEKFNQIMRLWTDLLQNPDNREIIPLFILKWNGMKVKQRIFKQFISTDSENIMQKITQRCSFSYYYYITQSLLQNFDKELWVVPLLVDAISSGKDEIVQFIPKIIHFAFLFSDYSIQQTSDITLKHSKSKSNYSNKLIEAIGQHYGFELPESLTDAIQLFIAKFPQNFLTIWGKEALRWLFGSSSIQFATISLIVYNALRVPNVELAIKGVCKACAYHLFSVPDASQTTSLISAAFKFYTKHFKGHEIFAFQFASSFLDCKVFLDNSLMSAAKIFIKSLSFEQTNQLAWKQIIGIVRPLVTHLEFNEKAQKILELLIKSTNSEELIMIAAPVKEANPKLFTFIIPTNQLFLHVTETAMCKALQHYSSMIETASPKLLDSLFTFSAKILQRVVNENNRNSLAKIYKSALNNISLKGASKFLITLAEKDPSIVSKSTYEFYDWNRSSEDVVRSLNMVMEKYEKDIQDPPVVTITDCNSLDHVYNFLNSEIIPKIIPFAAEEEMILGMQSVISKVKTKRLQSIARWSQGPVPYAEIDGKNCDLEIHIKSPEKIEFAPLRIPKTIELDETIFAKRNPIKFVEPLEKFLKN